LGAAIPFKYHAFVSYSHRDKAWGQWLHAALEGYRIDRDIVGRETPAGPVPRTLRPVFRDREDFAAGHSLTEQTNAALESSQFLVVVCSPNAARSPYVNEEIRRYKALGRGGNVIPIIVDGEPGEGERDCFPPALRFRIGPDGALTDAREEPIAADARPQGDGKDVAVLKLVAGLLGVGLDEIVRRSERAKRRRLRNWVSSLALLTTLFAGLAVWAEVNRREADAQRRNAVTSLNAATRTSNDLTFDLAMRFRNQAGVPSALVRDILSRAQKLQDALTVSGQTSPDLQYAQASVLLETALTLLGIGAGAGAFDAADRARQILELLLAASPRDPSIGLDLGVAHQRIGDALANSGKTAEALAAYEKARMLHEALVEADPSNGRAQQNVAVDHNKTGDLLVAGSRLDEALAVYRKSLEIMRRLVQRDERNAGWLRDLGLSYERIGIILARQNKLDQALDAFQGRLSIAQALANDKPENNGYQRDLSVAHNKVGEMLLAQGKPDDALPAYRKALAVRQGLVAADPANAIWSRDLAISHNMIGTVLGRQGKFDEALAFFQEGLAIGQKLVARDPSNIVWQGDLYTTTTTVGVLLARTGKLDAALKSFREGVAIALARTKAHPDNATWQNHLRGGVVQVGAHAWRLVLAREFGSGLEAADAAIALAPDIIWLHANRAHALLFLERAAEARDLYLQYRARKNVQDQKSWEDVILGDFAALRAAGLVHPLMDEIEQRLATGG
jgi:tetratricopeptide (TPR) repeat protein